MPNQTVKHVHKGYYGLLLSSLPLPPTSAALKRESPLPVFPKKPDHQRIQRRDPTSPCFLHRPVPQLHRDPNRSHDHLPFFLGHPSSFQHRLTGLSGLSPVHCPRLCRSGQSHRLTLPLRLRSQDLLNALLLHPRNTHTVVRIPCRHRFRPPGRGISSAN